MEKKETIRTAAFKENPNVIFETVSKPKEKMKVIGWCKKYRYMVVPEEKPEWLGE